MTKRFNFNKPTNFAAINQSFAIHTHTHIDFNFLLRIISHFSRFHKKNHLRKKLFRVDKTWSDLITKKKWSALPKDFPINLSPMKRSSNSIWVKHTCRAVIGQIRIKCWILQLPTQLILTEVSWFVYVTKFDMQTELNQSE